MQQTQIPLAVIAGPTASGKTALAVEMARRLNGEVISADSMQIYREMQIGTARPDEEETAGIPHHLQGHLSMTESYSVAQYVQDARAAIADIYGRGKLPIVAGGTGLYISSLVNGIEFTEIPRDEALSARLEMKAQQEGGEALLQELAAIDPETAARMHPNNLGRIVRALEVYYTTGITMTEQMRRSRLNAPNWKLGMLGITYADRGVLYDRINRRVTQMIDMGLEAETRRVLSQPGGKTALQAIGYKELAPYIRNECPLEDALENLRRATRRYAKRQLTWFRRDERIYWLEADRFPDRAAMYDEAEQQLRRALELPGGCKGGSANE